MKRSKTSNRVEWIWQGIGFSLPAEWECLQFARNPEVGRCAFADRYRFRVELNWRRFKREPDFERMLKDYAGSLEATWKHVKEVQQSGWPGVTGLRDDEVVTRYGRYFATQALLVEVVFIAEHKRDESVEHKMLSSIRSVGPDGDGFQQWRAFGMDVRVPPGFKLGECVVEPARVGLRFDGPHKPDRWVFRRYGMVSSWLNMPVRDWLESQTDAHVRDRRPSSNTQGNMSIDRLQGAWRPRGLLLPRGMYAASAWIDPRDQRLYQAICVTGRRSRVYHPSAGADAQMKSCPEFLVVP